MSFTIPAFLTSDVLSAVFIGISIVFGSYVLRNNMCVTVIVQQPNDGSDDSTCDSSCESPRVSPTPPTTKTTDFSMPMFC